MHRSIKDAFKVATFVATATTIVVMENATLRRNADRLTKLNNNDSNSLTQYFENCQLPLENFRKCIFVWQLIFWGEISNLLAIWNLKKNNGKAKNKTKNIFRHHNCGSGRHKCGDFKCICYSWSIKDAFKVAPFVATTATIVVMENVFCFIFCFPIIFF